MELSGPSFGDFFAQATGFRPYAYQERVARDGLPAEVWAPAGAGKTGVVLAWLWRRLYGPSRDATPRRLIYALPRHGPEEQAAGRIERWLADLGLAGEVPVHVAMGGAGHDQWRWREDMHRPAIVVGTADSLVSKALNRGYGVSRTIHPIDFALVTNGAHWLVDEAVLCPASVLTLRRLAALTASLGTAEPFGLTLMSATAPEAGDAARPARVARVGQSDRTGGLAGRLAATRLVRRLPAEPGAYAAIARAARRRHRPGTLTLVVVNTVQAARAVFEDLREGPAPCVLLHSGYRGAERTRLLDQATDDMDAAGRVVVATQVVEAGLDLDAAVLVTEAAPWPSVVLRAGRCNRAGRADGAELWWIPPAAAHPYQQADIDAAAAALAAIEGLAVTGEQLAAYGVPAAGARSAVPGRDDLMRLFDTDPGPDDADADVAPYVRDTDDLDVQLAWAAWERPSAAEPPPADARLPGAEWRCRVPLGTVREMLARGVPVWRFDHVLGRWANVTGRAPAAPGELLLVAAGDGGYDPLLGVWPPAKEPVPDCPPLTAFEQPVSDVEHAWLSLGQHSDDVRRQAEALVPALRPDLPAGCAEALAVAAYLHDAGKAHPIWQDALCALATDGRRQEIEAGRPWAKSGREGRLAFAGGVSFRHELASLLIVDGPLRPLLDGLPDPDLVRYLVLAHHGRLRVRVRVPGDLGLVHGATFSVPSLLGRPAGEVTVDLGRFGDGEHSWTRTVLALRDRYGPFRLAYLETVVRIADWRASGHRPCADTETPAPAPRPSVACDILLK